MLHNPIAEPTNRASLSIDAPKEIHHSSQEELPITSTPVENIVDRVNSQPNEVSIRLYFSFSKISRYISFDHVLIVPLCRNVPPK